MTAHLKGVFVSCLLLIILMGHVEPVLTYREMLKQKVKILEEVGPKLGERMDQGQCTHFPTCFLTQVISHIYTMETHPKLHRLFAYSL